MVAGAEPLYGTCTSLTPAMTLNNSPARCETLPTPADGKFSSPGRLRASAINSLIEAAGSDGCTATISGVAAICETATKSRNES